jgi:hypothetical protein
MLRNSRCARCALGLWIWFLLGLLMTSIVFCSGQTQRRVQSLQSTVFLSLSTVKYIACKKFGSKTSATVKFTQAISWSMLARPGSLHHDWSLLMPFVVNQSTLSAPCPCPWPLVTLLTDQLLPNHSDPLNVVWDCLLQAWESEICLGVICMPDLHLVCTTCHHCPVNT